MNHSLCWKTDKIRHDRRSGAERHIARLIEAGKATKGVARMYRCEHCGALHVTTQYD